MPAEPALLPAARLGIATLPPYLPNSIPPCPHHTQNQEVEQQLHTQQQLQQLAAAVGNATAAASGGSRPAGAAGLRAPPLVTAAATSPPNSQRKLLMHLTVSARPADAEVGGSKWGGVSHLYRCWGHALWPAFRWAVQHLRDHDNGV